MANPGDPLLAADRQRLQSPFPQSQAQPVERLRADLSVLRGGGGGLTPQRTGLGPTCRKLQRFVAEPDHPPPPLPRGRRRASLLRPPLPFLQPSSSPPP